MMVVHRLCIVNINVFSRALPLTNYIIISELYMGYIILSTVETLELTNMRAAFLFGWLYKAEYSDTSVSEMGHLKLAGLIHPNWVSGRKSCLSVGS